ncbi:MAG: hypothetical protein PHO63_04925 [Bacilli bacterium]|nr:hypothetical protein [Bacilli bacterium]MDD4808607.1 hypothetical protein [Bacilli bacterium]
MNNYLGTTIKMEDATYMIIWIQKLENITYTYLVNPNNVMDSFFGVLSLNHNHLDCVPVVNRKIIDQLISLFNDYMEKFLNN